MIDSIDLTTQLRDWVVTNSKHVDATTIDINTPILEKRILTSLQIMDLILFIEQLRKQPLDPASFKPGVFSSIAKIRETFFENA